MARPQKLQGMEGVLFDLGSTLVFDKWDDGRRTFEGLVSEEVNRFLGWAGYPFAEEFGQKKLFPMRHRWVDIYRGREQEFTYRELLFWLFGKLGVEEQGLEELTNTVINILHRVNLDAWRTDPDTPAVLQELQGRGYQLGVVSNSNSGREHLAEILRVYGLDGYFRFVVSSGDLGIAKPHPKIFELGVRALGLEDPAVVAFVGNDLEADIAGAGKAGLIPVWLPDGNGGKAPKDTIILQEIKDLLGILE